jgi:hypothetical protein
MKYLFLFFLLANWNSIYSQEFDKMSVFPNKEEYLVKSYSKENTWIFILAGQSNMAGRAIVAPSDTIANDRILAINIENKIIMAKEPISFFESDKKGLSCGLAFGKELIKNVPDSICVLLIPAAVGGSSIDKWIGDSIHRNVKLLSNLKRKVAWAKKNGIIKGVLWHQGESDALSKEISNYKTKLKKLFTEFRRATENDKLIILSAEIGMFRKNNSKEKVINKQIQQNVFLDPYAFLVKSKDFKSIGDDLHFDSKSQRILGQRFAQKYLEIIRK